MVPVLDVNKKPLMPCSEKRAKKLLNNGVEQIAMEDGLPPRPRGRGITPCCRMNASLWDELDEISAELEKRGILRLAEDVRATASTITKTPLVILKNDFGGVVQGSEGIIISSVKDYYKIQFANKIIAGIHKSNLTIKRS